MVLISILKQNFQVLKKNVSKLLEMWRINPLFGLFEMKLLEATAQFQYQYLDLVR